MGGEKTSQSQNTQVQATPEEQELNRLALERARASQGQLINVQSQGLDIASALLRGQSLPGYLNKLPGGISPEVTQDIANKAIQDVRTSFQSQGILDSGTAMDIASRTSADIRTQAEQFNLQNLLQLLNIGVGGQAQVQSPILESEAHLGGRLSGLRSVSSSGRTVGMNPFLKSFQTSLGQTLGSPSFKKGPFDFGGA